MTAFRPEQGPRHGARVRATVHTERAEQLTQSADLLADVQSVPLVGDGLQHLLQGAVQLSVLLLRWPDSLTQTGEGRHLRAGIMTVRANSYRRHRFTAASRRLRGAQERGAAAAGGGGTWNESRIRASVWRCGPAGGRDRSALLWYPGQEQVGRAAEGDCGPSVVQISWKHPSHFL